MSYKSIIYSSIYSTTISLNKEIGELEAHIQAEGDTELNNLKSALTKEEATVRTMKEEAKLLLKLLDAANGMVDMAERFWDKKRQVEDKKDDMSVSRSCIINRNSKTCVSPLSPFVLKAQSNRAYEQ